MRAFFKAYFSSWIGDDSTTTIGDNGPKFLCVVCFSEVPLNEASGLQCPASSEPRVEPHATCGACISSWVRAELDSNKLRFTCPDFECGRPLHEPEVQAALGPALWTRLERMRHAQDVDRDPLMRWCPKSECGQVCRRTSLRERRVVCSSCDPRGERAFCADCAGPWTERHSTRCREEVVVALRPSSARSGLSLLSWNLFKHSTSQRCPTCRTLIDKVF